MAPTFEHRKLYRADVTLKIEYESANNAAVRGVTYSKNLSSTGISVVMPVRMKKGDRLNLRIHMPYSTEPIAAEAEVLWLDKCSHTGAGGKEYYVTGLRICDMAPASAIIESDFVRDVLIEKSNERNKDIIKKIEEA